MKAFLSIFLSWLILMSSTGLTYASHYCLGHNMLSKVTLGEKPLSCGMVMEVTACDDDQEASHGCCSNTYLQVDTDDHFAKVTFDFAFHKAWAVQPLASYPDLNLTVEGNAVCTVHRYRPPPLPERDLLILYQTFLI